MQLPSKEPLKTDTKPPVLPYISVNGAHNANESTQSTKETNSIVNNIIKDKNILDNEQKMNESKILNNSTFTLRMIDKIENWSPSTAKYARLSVFGCKVSSLRFK